MLECYGCLRIRVFPSNYLLTLPVDLIALYTICRCSNILTLRYTSIPIQQSPKAWENFSVISQ